MMEIPISQIRLFEKPRNASLSAAVGLPGLVTPVSATSAMAMMEMAPMGRALPIIAAIVPTNSARRCHALGVTSCGAGITNQIISVIIIAIREGTGFSGVIRSIIFSLFQR